MTADNAASSIPDVPVACAVNALDHHKSGACCEATVNLQRGASAGVTAHLADAGKSGKKIGNVCTS